MLPGGISTGGTKCLKPRARPSFSSGMWPPNVTSNSVAWIGPAARAGFCTVERKQWETNKANWDKNRKGKKKKESCGSQLMAQRMSEEDGAPFRVR